MVKKPSSENSGEEKATPGCYRLVIRLGQSRKIQIGRLGRFEFPAGLYIYTGSAKAGVQARVARHKRRKKKLHWHIDYLLRYGKVEEAIIHPGLEVSECELNRRALDLPGAVCVAKGFGSSDCRCETHLVYVGETKAIIAWVLPGTG